MGILARTVLGLTTTVIIGSESDRIVANSYKNAILKIVRSGSLFYTIFPDLDRTSDMEWNEPVDSWPYDMVQSTEILATMLECFLY